MLVVYLAGLLLWQSSGNAPVQAQQEPPDADEPGRLVTLTIDYTLYAWWLIRWSDNQAVCTVLTEHEGLPTTSDIEYHCSAAVQREWNNTEPCPYNSNEKYKCPGLYLYQAGSSQQKRTVEVQLPLPQVSISLEGCDPQPPAYTCQTAPNLVLIGDEPLPNEQIIRLQGTINGKPFSCPGKRCSLPMQPTGEEGALMEFWADSSFGDASPLFTALVRMVPWGGFVAPDGEASGDPLWYVGVLSSQWRGSRPATCSDTWQVFPEIGGPPPWLTTPADPTGLESSISYYFLAGMLIRSGAVDASMCPDYGMQDDTTASECGVEKAMPEMIEWQNRFDSEILRIAGETGIPAQLLKNIFSRESQFWPGIFQTFEEAGLGQMTEKGADAVLLWNPDFFDQFCPLVLSSEICGLGFGNLASSYQNMLRGALVSTVNATCMDCPMGIDLRQAEFSISVFAETLLANCVQVEQTLYNLTSQPAGSVSSYEDLWRFTLVNYNAGPGCLARAAKFALLFNQRLTWDGLSENLEEACYPAVEYVDAVSQVPIPVPTPTPWVTSVAAIQPEYPPLPTPTPAPPPTMPPF